MGPPSTVHKKPGRNPFAQPWHIAYNQLNLSQLFLGVIPKRIRSILAAKARLKGARTAKAANVERRHIKTCLAGIEEVYSKIRKALRDGGDLHRWKAFPGLEAAVKQVDNIDWSDVQAKRIPGGPFKCEVPKFDGDPSLSDTKTIKSNDVATGLIIKREPVQKHVKEEVKVEVKDEIKEEGEIREEGEIKEEDEVKIKHETQDEPGVVVDIGGTSEHLPSPDSATPNHDPQPPPYQWGYPYETFGDCPSESPLQWMPHFPFPQPGYPPNYWHGLPHHYFQHSFPPFYPFMPYYNFGFASSGFDSSLPGETDSQFPYGASHPQFHAFPQRLAVPAPAPPGIPPRSFLPPPSSPPPSLTTPGSILPSKPSPATKPPAASPLGSVIAKQPANQLGGKRKLSHSPGVSSDPGRPLKRRAPAQIGSTSEAGDHQYKQSKHPSSANGLPDFGAWFQEQVTDSKKKLSHLENMSTLSGNKKGP